MNPESTTKHYLVAGAGFVGGSLVSQLREAGHRVTSVTRSECDLTNSDSVNQFAERTGGGVDGIVHCASSSSRGGGDREAAYRAIYLEGCRHLLAAFRPEAFIFTSSTSVYAQTDGSEVTEIFPAGPSGATGKILRQTEIEVLASGFTVVRLAGIYGPGRSFLLKKFLEGSAVIDGLEPDTEGRWINQIHRDDAASALAFLLGKNAGAEVFNVCDSAPMRQRTFYQHMLQRYDQKMPPVSAPDPDRKRGWSDKAVSNAKLRGLGWLPFFPSYFDALDAGAVSAD